jgi:hypothetical protein
MHVSPCAPVPVCAPTRVCSRDPAQPYSTRASLTLSGLSVSTLRCHCQGSGPRCGCRSRTGAHGAVSRVQSPVRLSVTLRAPRGRAPDTTPPHEPHSEISVTLTGHRIRRQTLTPHKHKRQRTRHNAPQAQPRTSAHNHNPHTRSTVCRCVCWMSDVCMLLHVVSAVSGL